MGGRVAHMRAKQIDSRKMAALDRYVVGAPLAGALYAKTKIKRNADTSKLGRQGEGQQQGDREGRPYHRQPHSFT